MFVWVLILSFVPILLIRLSGLEINDCPL